MLEDLQSLLQTVLAEQSVQLDWQADVGLSWPERPHVASKLSMQWQKLRRMIAMNDCLANGMTLSIVDISVSAINNVDRIISY